MSNTALYSEDDPLPGADSNRNHKLSRQVGVEMISPTGKNQIRMDTHGSGKFQAPRGARLHMGTDWACEPNQWIVAPCSARLNRILTVYEDTRKFKGIELYRRNFTIWLFYLDPITSLVGHRVKKGQRVGRAQDLRERYGPDIIPHVELRIYINPELMVKL
jgi:hypothetical protein